MPEKRTIKKAQKAKREGKSASTQAGSFVHEAIEHVKKGKHGAKSTKQAIAIGLSEARRSGVAIPDKSSKKKATSKKTTTKKAASKKTATRKASAKKTTTKKTTGRIAAKKVSAKRSAAAKKRLQSEPTNTVSHAALSRHAKTVAHKRGKAALHASAMKAARTRAKHAR